MEINTNTRAPDHTFNSRLSVSRALHFRLHTPPNKNPETTRHPPLPFPPQNLCIREQNRAWNFKQSLSCSNRRNGSQSPRERGWADVGDNQVRVQERSMILHPFSKRAGFRQVFWLASGRSVAQLVSQSVVQSWSGFRLGCGLVRLLFKINGVDLLTLVDCLRNADGRQRHAQHQAEARCHRRALGHSASLDTTTTTTTPGHARLRRWT